MPQDHRALEWVRLEHPVAATGPPTVHGAEDWVRVDGEAQGVYVLPDEPDWCVANTRGDFVLKRLLAGALPGDIATEYATRFGVPPAGALLDVARFMRCVEHRPARAYEGRAAHLRLERLRECWLHVTNRCNARCSHCMFCSSPTRTDRLPTDAAMDVVRQATELGCEIFYFTGGEPFMHEGLLELVRWIVGNTAAHVVILTNAIAAPAFLTEMADLPRERVHFQVSVDGVERNHDAVRGRGAYRLLRRNLDLLRRAGFPVTLAMAAHRGNLADMPQIVRLAGDAGVGNVHYMWLFVRGNAHEDIFAPPEEIFPHLLAACRAADELGVLVDNVELLRSQVFSIPGSRFDLSNAGWESLAVGPDGGVYPSPALVGEDRVLCGSVGDGLEAVWRGSHTLEGLREATLADSRACLDNPLRFLVGGGDVDHSLLRGGDFVGHDPYVPLYNRVALHLIAREAARFPDAPHPGFRLRMGDRLGTCARGDGVFCTHSNCVLSLADLDGHSLVRDFYTRAAQATNDEILNPSTYSEQDLAHVPAEARTRSYGCGSPVADAALRPGEAVVDLGCGAGLECFVAARQVGPTGRVTGVDMLPAMLHRARESAREAVDAMGYDNMEFRQGLLEDLPLDDASVDVVLSNCVINLCPEKRRVFAEIGRVLRPGGRLVVADVASATEIPIELQYNEKLRGECIGGAFRQERLFELLADVGFGQITLIKRVPYREVRGHQFYSITYSAVKPVPSDGRRLIYRGPFAAVVTDDGRVIERGGSADVPWREDTALGESVFVLDADGTVTNVEQALACSCSLPPETDGGAASSPADGSCCAPAPEPVRHSSGCMVCGEPLSYLPVDAPRECYYCGQVLPANATCPAGHFVCDECHGGDALATIERICLASSETDMVALLARIRSHGSIPVHGPEHHALVPAVIVTAYRNCGGAVTDGQVRAAIARGHTICGGACAFLGSCGAATGVSAAFAIILGANPYKGELRRALMAGTGRVLQHLAQFDAARCCQRDCWIGLKAAAELSRELLDIPLTADAPLRCEQVHLNNECLGAECPLWPASRGDTE